MLFTAKEYSLSTTLRYRISDSFLSRTIPQVFLEAAMFKDYCPGVLFTVPLLPPSHVHVAQREVSQN